MVSFSTNCLKQFSLKEVVRLILQKLHKHLHVKYQLFLSHFTVTPIILTDFQNILIKFDTFKFNENVSIGSRVVPHRQTDRQMNSQADMMKLIIHFCNSANAPKHYILKLIVNFSINESLEICSTFKKLKITFVWKHEYSNVIKGCEKARINASFSVSV